MKVFISWSGSLSQRVAEALKDWLPTVIQAVDPWISSEDINKGARWSLELATELSKTKVGILCVTSDNLEAPWLIFEAGALCKAVENTFVCPYLIGLRPSDLKGPLAEFQAAEANKADTRRLINTLNMALEDRALSDRVFEKAFESRWPEFESSLLLAQSEEKTPQAPQRKDHEILEEILGLVRDQARRNPGALTIQSAKYGSRGQYVDVTQILAERVSGGHLEVYAGNQLAGDPSPGDTKELVVEYIYGNQVHIRSVLEGGTLSLP